MANAILCQRIGFRLFANKSLSGHEVFDGVNIFISSPYTWAVFFVGIIIFAVLKRVRGLGKAVAYVVLAVSLTDSLTFFVFKGNIKRLRPCKERPAEVTTPSGCSSLYGFPSNHAANSAAIAATVYLVGFKSFGILLMALAFFISLSRVFLGVHYPGDVVAGMITGIIYSIFLVFFLDKLSTIFNKRSKP